MMKLKTQEEYITQLQNKNDELTRFNAELLLLVARLEAVSRAQNEALVVFAKEINQLKQQELSEKACHSGFTLH